MLALRYPSSLREKSVSPLNRALAVALALATGACADPMPKMGGSYDGNASAEPLREMAAGRKVSEQDCSGPIDFSTGNLRCK